MKKITLLTLGAALIAVPAIAAPGAKGDPNATLTRTDAQTRATEMFARLDANKDGKVDQADRAARHAERQAKMFERLDTDKNGSISKAEWDQHGADRQAKRAERGEKRAQRAEAGEGKRHAMRGGDGKRGGHRMGGHRMGGPGGWMKADANGDKAITQAEFVAASLARFDSMDANKDGQVTPEERKAVREAKRAEWQAKRAAPAPTGN
ncbi:MAG: hypothetical protein DI569_08650 [Sphingopyxis macrogoltabida]|uniref:EF-hand domain-containing protein n=1 Tax=Sphingopyxis macrogoltabida TaxID=33050 RepID=A0A2W5L1Z7_SPHMC|nr:MAG: hypothetical protein DI569_08650 [Sphingopyxis macrogoltabida]